MNRTFKATTAALMLAVSFAGSVGAGPFEDAAAAYRKGDYAAALGIIRPLAEEGNVAAQFNLGVMFQLSHGVPQDNEAAVSWYRKAAEQGLAEAQYNLGVMYANGEGVAQDYVASAHGVRFLGVGEGHPHACLLAQLFFVFRRIFRRPMLAG